MSDVQVAPHVERLQAVRVEPGDVIIVSLDREWRPTTENMDALRETLRHFWPDNEVLFTGGISISVVRSEPQAEATA